MAESSSATEILQNIPSVSVDINGGISLRNSSNITYFINGRPSAMLRRGASSILQQIPASSIERIEIITNPSAKYRPDGVGGIINIVLKKEIKKGFNGQVGANIGTEYRYNSNLNLNYSKKKINYFANYGIRRSAGTSLYTDNREFKNINNGNINGKYLETGNSSPNGLSHSVFSGINYKMNDYNNVEVAGYYFLLNTVYNSFADISSLDSLGNSDYHFTNTETNNEFEKEAEIDLTYEHIFKNNEDHILSFEATHSTFNEKEDLSYNQTYNLPTSSTEITKNLIQKNGYQQEFMLDYTLPVGEDSEFESGYSSEFVFENLSYTQNAIPTQFLFNQEIHAFYALYGQSFNKFSFKTGVRAEQAFIKSQLKQPIDSLALNSYFKLFPTFHLGYELNDITELSLSYSKRIKRPDADELNPNLEYSDPRNAEAGNPNLKPEQIHTLELGYQSTFNKITLNAALYYRYKYDGFTEIQNNIGDSLVVSTITNLNNRESGGIEINLSGKIFKKCDYRLTGDVFYTTINASYQEN